MSRMLILIADGSSDSNGLQPGQGATELGFPRPAPGEMYFAILDGSGGVSSSL